jgi:NADPH:quinone reductase-like Zn-dependent oxidoreductase
MPSNLSFKEAATLTCAGVTAWDALYNGRNALKPGDWVLTQGTGGVSIFAVQFALAAGAKVISTTSSDAKAKVLKDLGAHHVLNYKTDQNWGATAKKLTNGLGVDHIIEVGGPTTMAQSYQAIRADGTISIIGFLGGFAADPGASALNALQHLCNIRGILVGSRVQFDNMNRAIEAKNIKPVVDRTFEMKELKEAYQYMWDQKHLGKVVINVS